MIWIYSDAVGGMRLQVPNGYEEQAKKILSEDASELVEHEQGIDTARGAVCGSINTEPFQRGKRWAFLVFLGIGFPLFPTKNTVRCKDCTHIE
jgi:hypothetical protein